MIDARDVADLSIVVRKGLQEDLVVGNRYDSLSGLRIDAHVMRSQISMHSAVRSAEHDNRITGTRSFSIIE